jgi:hypothetical protein
MATLRTNAADGVIGRDRRCTSAVGEGRLRRYQRAIRRSKAVGSTGNTAIAVWFLANRLPGICGRREMPWKPAIGASEKGSLPDSCRPQTSKDSRNFACFCGIETGTVFGTVSLGDLEPWAEDGEKTLMKSVVGVTGFEPATPTSRTYRPQRCTKVRTHPLCSLRNGRLCGTVMPRRLTRNQIIRPDF